MFAVLVTLIVMIYCSPVRSTAHAGKTRARFVYNRAWPDEKISDFRDAASSYGFSCSPRYGKRLVGGVTRPGFVIRRRDGPRANVRRIESVRKNKKTTTTVKTRLVDFPGIWGDKNARCTKPVFLDLLDRKRDGLCYRNKYAGHQTGGTNGS